MLVPGDLAILQAIQVLLKFQKMLVGIHFFDCHARRQLHKDVSLYVNLGVGHYKVNGPHVPPPTRRLGQMLSSMCHQTPGNGPLCTNGPSTSGFLLRDPFCIAGSIPLEGVWQSSELETSG